jgi:hypothetical protein
MIAEDPASIFQQAGAIRCDTNSGGNGRMSDIVFEGRLIAREET